MVIGGYVYGDGYLDVVEVVDLDDPNNMCTIVANYPVEVGDLTVAYYNGVVRSCGGEELNDCYEYHPEDNTWVSTAGLRDGRSGVRSSLIDGTWLISGSNVDPIGTQTEMWVEDHFQQGPNLPELMAAHCQTTINATHIFFADCYDQTAYLFNWSEQEWIQVDNMERDRDYDCGCGLIRSETNGKEYVVAGFGTSEIFNFDTMSWRTGPTLPYGYGYASVQLEDTFVLVGGYEDDYTDRMYVFDQDNYAFALKSQRLQHPRAYAGAVALPDDAVNCS